MRKLEKAWVLTLRALDTLTAYTKYSADRLSVAVVNPKQTLLKPGAYVEVDSEPLEDSDSSAVQQSDVTVFLVATKRGDVLEMAQILENECRNENDSEKKFDISNADVYCISNTWVSNGRPKWSDALDCFEMPVNFVTLWSLK